MRDKRTMTLPTDSAQRKEYPLLTGVLRYFPAALAGVARTSKLGNDKHNPGQEMHHARGKSTDHGDCIIRHLTDVQDLLAQNDRRVDINSTNHQEILDEVSSLAWRALALSQELHERFGAPLAPGAKENLSSTPTNAADDTQNDFLVVAKKVMNENQAMLKKLADYDSVAKPHRKNFGEQS